MVLVVGFISGTYGVLQHLGKDPIKWNNPYNAVIGTLGNPDFAAAVMAILAVITFGVLIKAKSDIKFRFNCGP
jgi:hypothetical protein